MVVPGWPASLALMTTTPRASRASRPAAALLTLAGAALALTGCAAGPDQETADALASADERIASAEAEIADLKDRMDRVPDTAAMQSQASEAVSSAVAQATGAAGSLGADAARRAQEAVDGVSGLPDAEAVQQVEDGGRVIVEYAQDALPKDPAELQARLGEAADAVRRQVPDSAGVEFKVGDQTFTF